MAKYYRRPDGLYETSRTVNGKRIKFRGRTCQEVDRKILEFNTQQKRGRKVPVIVDEWSPFLMPHCSNRLLTCPMMSFLLFFRILRQWSLPSSPQRSQP